MVENFKIITLSLTRNRMSQDLKFKEWLEHVTSIGDEVIILDNDSDDGTLEFIKEFDKEDKITLIQGVTDDFTTQEPRIRTMLWEACKKVARPNDWVLVIDSDEFFDENFVKEKKDFLKNIEEKGFESVSFKFCDMWDENNYRIDGFWSPYFTRLFKFKNQPFSPSGGGLHQSNIPKYAFDLKTKFSYYKVAHYSIHTPELRKQKYDYYSQHCTGINLQHAKSIMTPAELKPLKTEWPKILLCSPIRNREWILPHFLERIEKLDYPTEKLKIFFTTNDCTDKSIQIIEEWEKTSRFKGSIEILNIEFEKNERKHERDWNQTVIQNMIFLRNKHLQKLKESDCEYAFSIDSDILLHPEVLKVTLLQDKKIISPVFWAKWNGETPLPQCWQYDGYGAHPEWFSMLKNVKGRFLCGGLGAQTLISREVSETSGVNYNMIYNLSAQTLWGEDRWFCVRAVTHGFDLWCHTLTESIHVDKPEDLSSCLEKTKEWN